MEFLDEFGIPNSVYPCTKYLTFAPWIYLVPQYKPESVLLLGYAGGTVAGLIKLLYGHVPITAVDIEPRKENLYYINFIQADAEEYVKDCKKFDCVIVDLFPNNGHDICKFVKSKDFASNLKRISRYIIINSIDESGWEEYNIFKSEGINRPAHTNNLIRYYSNESIPELYFGYTG